MRDATLLTLKHAHHFSTRFRVHSHFVQRNAKTILGQQREIFVSVTSCDHINSRHEEIINLHFENTTSSA
jgi:hypothetical protein